MRKPFVFIVLLIAAIVLLYSTELRLAGVPHAAAAHCGTVDVAFVIDDTGSKGPAFANIVANLDQVVTALTENPEPRVALVTFKDGVVVRRNFIDISDAGNEITFRNDIQLLAASGGAGPGEASDEALDTVVNNLTAADRGNDPSKQIEDFTGLWTGTTRIVLLVTDNPPSGFNDIIDAVDLVHAKAVVDQAKTAGIRIESVLVPTKGVTNDLTVQARNLMRDQYRPITQGGFVETAQDGSNFAASIVQLIQACGQACTCQPVGGIAELPEVAGTPLETDGSSGTSAGVLAGAIAGAVLVGGVTLGGAAWYARRRLSSR